MSGLEMEQRATVNMPVSLELAAPTLETGSWLGDMARLRTANAMRAALAARYPALTRPRALAIVGAAGEGARLAELASAAGIAIKAVADDSPRRQGSPLGGCSVRPVDALANIDTDIPVIIASHRPLTLVQRLRAMGFGTVAPFWTLQLLDGARFPPHMFYDGLLEDMADNMRHYQALPDMLGDDTSRRHLDAVIGLRLTGDLGAIAPIIDWDVYWPRDLFTLGQNEVYVDGGAYDGDSIQLFSDRVGGRFDRALGFEPDPATCERLKSRFADDPRVEAIPKGLHSREDMLAFVNDGSRAAIFSDDGGMKVPVTSLDHVLDGGRATFVKMNIEGAEQEALRGAARTIAKWRPRLAISAYHRPADLWQVPVLMRELRSDYKLALRQHDAGTVETVAYAL